MKKLLFLTPLLLIPILSGCTASEKNIPDAEMGKFVILEEYNTSGDEYQNEGKIYKVYDKETNIIYLVTKTLSSSHARYEITGISSYYSENGKICKWENGEVKEL